MNNRVVIRSLVIPEGYIAAMDDGMVSWRPNEGHRRNTRLPYPVTTLLAVGGPSGKCESIWCGDTQGNITHISIPMMEIIDNNLPTYFPTDKFVPESATAVGGPQVEVCCSGYC